MKPQKDSHWLPGKPTQPVQSFMGEWDDRHQQSILPETPQDSSPAAPPGFLVVLSHTGNEPTAEGLAALEKLFQLSDWIARQRLLFPGPQILSRHTVRAAAEQQVIGLLHTGLEAFVLPEDELEETIPRTIRSIAPGPRAFVVTHTDGTVENVPIVDVISFCIGKPHERVIEERTDRTGIAGAVERTTASVQQESVRIILDIHRISSRQLLRLDQLSLDFSTLFPGKNRASDPMMLSTIEWLKKSAAQATVHDSFAKVVGGYQSTWMVIEARTQLLVRWMRSLLEPSVTASRVRVLSDSEVMNFGLYSALTRAETFRRRAAAAPPDRD